jgi:hypothetical protein
MFTKWMDNTAAAGGNGNANTAGQTAEAGAAQQQKPFTYEAWLESQDDQIREMLEGHTKGLKTALDSERESRKGYEKQLRELAKKAEAGSDAQKQLTEMADQIKTAESRADFYDAAHREGVTNLKLAYLVATQEDLFDKAGRVNFAEMKKSFPELFASSNGARGDAGSGTGGGQTKGQSMDEMIRGAAGRK